MKYTLLIVDDSPELMFVLRRLFEKQYNVFTACDGVEAIAHLEQGIMPNLIISDLNMHNINGYELVKHLSTSKIYDKIPVIILSGYHEAEKEFLKDQFIARIINKPFDPVTLLNIVEEILLKPYYAKKLKRADAAS